VKPRRLVLAVVVKSPAAAQAFPIFTASYLPLGCGSVAA
jgi:hypothetical protein